MDRAQRVLQNASQSLFKDSSSESLGPYLDDESLLRVGDTIFTRDISARSHGPIISPIKLYVAYLLLKHHLGNASTKGTTLHKAQVDFEDMKFWVARELYHQYWALVSSLVSTT